MSTELTVIEKANQTLPTAPAVLSKNQSYLSVYTKSADKLLEKATAELQETGRLTTATDAELNKWQVSAKLAMDAANKARSPITQMLTLIAKEFTNVESEFSTLYSKVQAPRNQSAAKIKSDRDAADQAANNKLAKDQELVNLNAAIEKGLRLKYSEIVNGDKQFLTDTLNNLTLTDMSAAKDTFEGINPEFKPEKWIVDIDNLPANFHTAQEINALTGDMKAAKLKTVSDHYAAVMKAAVAEVIALIPAKTAELEAIENAGKKEKAKLLKDAKDKAAADKLAAEAATKAEAEKIEAQVEANKSEAAATVSYNNAVSSLKTDAELKGPRTLTNYKIEVLNKTGWTELISFWLQEGAKDEELDKFEKKTFAQIKLFAERAASKANGTKLVTDNLRYTEDIKAVAVSGVKKAA